MSFLTAVLADASFPAPVAPEVLGTYARRFPSVCVTNPTLTTYAPRLLNQQLSVADRRALVRSGSPGALEAILASPEHCASVLADVLRTYALCVADQLRFVDRPLEASVADWVRECSRFTDEARALAADNRAQRPRSTRFFTVIGAVTSDPVSHVRSPRLITSAPDAYYENFTAHYVSDLGDDYWLDLIRPVLRGPILTRYLGAGRSPQSRRAWSSFLILVKDDPDVMLKTVLESAAALGRAPE